LSAYLSNPDVSCVLANVVQLGKHRLNILLAAPTKVQHRAFELLGVALTA
jgi:hypothetical protein